MKPTKPKAKSNEAVQAAARKTARKVLDEPLPYWGRYEKEVCSSATMIAGGKHDPHRVLVPWAALGRRDMTVASDSGGGYMRGTENLSAADVLRPWSVTAKAGLTVVENLQGNVTIPRVRVNC